MVGRGGQIYHVSIDTSRFSLHAARCAKQSVLRLLSFSRGNTSIFSSSDKAGLLRTGQRHSSGCFDVCGRAVYPLLKAGLDPWSGDQGRELEGMSSAAPRGRHCVFWPGVPRVDRHLHSLLACQLARGAYCTTYRLPEKWVEKTAESHCSYISSAARG